MCKVIEKALPTTKQDNRFEIKGTFNHPRIFEEYLKREERKMKPKLKAREKGNESAPSRRINLQ